MKTALTLCLTVLGISLFTYLLWSSHVFRKPTPALEQEINEYRGEYVYGNPEAKGAIKAHINDKLEGVDRDQLSPEVKEFVNNL